MIAYAGPDRVLHTERLTLRPFQATNVAAFAGMNADPAVMRYLGGPRSRERTKDQMQHANDTLAMSGYGKVAVERTADGVFLGMCGFSIEHWYPDDLEIGWRLSPAFQGHGYATEAAKGWLDYGFETLKLTRVISIADVPNLASIAVMKRLGMRREREAMLSVDGDDFAAVIYVMERG